MVGRSGTAKFGRSGTARSVDREPELRAKPRNLWAGAPLNSPNKESPGFLLTAAGLWTGTRSAPSSPAGGPHEPNVPPTHVTLVWRKGIREDWLRFGKPVASRVVDRRTRIESYAPGQVFAFIGWASNGYGTVRSVLAIMRAVGQNEACNTLPQIDPGADLLLSVRGWPKVRRVLAMIDAIEDAGIDPCDVAPDHWRHMHNQLAAAMPPRRYAAARHRAWLRREALQP